MCGFAGLASVGADALAALAAARGCLERRGPDAAWVGPHGIWSAAATRLAIVDRTPLSDPPLLDPSGEVLLLYNGELYEPEALRARLAAGGHRFRSRGDGEIVLAAYLERGEAFLELLDGMFALAVLDRRRSRLLLARDRFGEKPLFFARTSRGLAFASTGAAIAPLLDRAEADEESLAAIVRQGFAPGDASALRGVRSVPPGAALLFEEGRDEPRVLRMAEIAPKDEGDREESFRRLLRRAVRRRARSERGVGLFLSGGLDSGAIAWGLAEEGIAATAFTAGFRGEPDERPLARATAAAFRLPWREIELGPELLEEWEPLTREAGEPLADGSALNLHALARRAREEVAIALAGEGGDELFGGYRRERAYAAIAELPVPRAVAAAVATLPGEAGRIGAALGRPRGLARYHELRDRTAEAEELLLPEFRRGPAGADGARDSVESDLRSYLPNDLLRRLDAATMAASLEARAPFLDPDLVAFARALPPAERRSRLAGKVLVRRALAGRLPAEVLRGRKRGFGAPLARWFRETDFLERTLASCEPPVDRAAVAAAIREHRSGRRDRSLVLARAIAVELFRRTLRR